MAPGALRRAAGRGLAAAAWALTQASRRVQAPAHEERSLAGDRDVEWAWVAAHLSREPGRVLDLGAGKGLLTLAAALAGHRVVAVDLEPSAFAFDDPRVEFRHLDEEGSSTYYALGLFLLAP